MNPQESSPKLLVVFVAWSVAMIVSSVFYFDLNQWLFVIFDIVVLAIVSIGFVLFCVALANYFAEKRKSNLVVMVAVFLLLTIHFSGASFYCGTYVYFQINKKHFENLLVEAEKSGTVAYEVGVVDENSSQRFAFYVSRGMTDNWVGAVHDPTNRLGEINHWNRWSELNDPNYILLSSLFGGTLYRCQDVGDGWYICWFT